MMTSRIYLYPGSGPADRHYIDSIGTVRDLAESGLILSPGLRVPFYDLDANEQGNPDELWFEGTVHYDETCRQWYALLDWSSFRHASEVSYKTVGEARVA